MKQKQKIFMATVVVMAVVALLTIPALASLLWSEVDTGTIEVVMNKEQGDSVWENVSGYDAQIGISGGMIIEWQKDCKVQPTYHTSQVRVGLLNNGSGNYIAKIACLDYFPTPTPAPTDQP